MKRILVLFTGGTIGSSTTEDKNWIEPDLATQSVLINKYREIGRDDVEFEAFSPFWMLSECLGFRELNFLLRSVESGACEIAPMEPGAPASKPTPKFDGIIVTHGSDTLQFTAAALGMSFAASKMPIVMVCSQLPLEDPESNAVANFQAAVEMIMAGAEPGVYAAYRNQADGPVDIHCGNALRTHQEMNDALTSESPWGAFVDGQIVRNPDYVPVEAGFTLPRGFTFAPDSGVAVVEAVPGMLLPTLTGKETAIIVRPYHSGTINATSLNIRNWLEKTEGMGVPCFLCSAKEGAQYATCKEYGELKLRVLPGQTFATLYMRLWAQASM